MKNLQLGSLSLVAAGSAATAGLFLLTGMQGADASFIHGDVREFLNHVSMVDLPDGQGGFNRTVRIAGINVQVVNGMGSTDSMNGTGNLVVGYNELGNPDGDDRRGSHNIVGGRANTHASWGGLVVGEANTVSGQFSSVSGGMGNKANGDYSSVSAGLDNAANGPWSSVSGGQDNRASGGGCSFFSCQAGGSVSGGYNNTASGDGSSISGTTTTLSCSA